MISKPMSSYYDHRRILVVEKLVNESTNYHGILNVSNNEIINVSEEKMAHKYNNSDNEQTDQKFSTYTDDKILDAIEVKNENAIIFAFKDRLEIWK